MPKIATSWDGFKWHIRSDKGYRDDSIVLTKREGCVLKTLTALASREKSFTEVGVHVGYYAIRMSTLYGKVYAIEPNPFSIECLKANISLNNARNIEIFQVACGDKDEEKEMYIEETPSSFLREPLGAKRLKVQVKRLENLLEKTDVIKIDVEGYEEWVILGATKVIEESKPVIIIEQHEGDEFYNLIP